MLAAGKQNALLPHDDSNRAKKKHSKQLSVSFIRTIPSAPESHRISGCLGSRSRAYGLMADYRRWGVAPRPETDFLPA